MTIERKAFQAGVQAVKDGHITSGTTKRYYEVLKELGKEHEIKIVIHMALGFINEYQKGKNV